MYYDMKVTKVGLKEINSLHRIIKASGRSKLLVYMCYLFKCAGNIF